MQPALRRPQTTMVGRQSELAELRRRLLAGERLLTLTGPPGVGKTRLALEVADAVRDRFDDGVAAVALGPIPDEALVPAAIASALGMADAAPDVAPRATRTGGGPSVPALAAAIGSRRILLLLDNMEHLLSTPPVADAPTGTPPVTVPPVAALVAELLQRCPELAILVTSRAALLLSAERELPVPPLSLPDPGGASVEDVGASDAVRLFVERARRVRPQFSLGAHNAKHVAVLCRALDGLPLAIELAAARVRVLPPDDLARQLDDRLGLLTGGPRDAPARHKTLRAAIDWSYRLLSVEEQRLFRHLAVFVGGFDVEAAGAVAGPTAPVTGAPPRLRVIGGVEALAQHSLLATDAASGRLGMLELIRDFALERLGDSGGLPETRWRHARHYAALAARAEPLLRSAAQVEWVERLERDRGNLRAALGWLLERSREADSAEERQEAQHRGLQLAGGVWWFWHLHSHVFEGREWLSSFLALPDPSRPPLPARPPAPEVVRERAATRARALFAAGFLAWSSGFWAWDPRDRELARRYQDESLAAFRALGDHHGEAYALWGLGLAMDGGDKAEQEATLGESLARFRDVGDRWGIVKALEHLGDRGQRSASRRRWEEALPVARELGEPQCLITILRLLGLDALRERDAPGARRYLEECRSVLQSSGLLSPASITRMALGHLALLEEDIAAAMDCFAQALQVARQMGSRRYTGESLLGLAAAAAAGGEEEHALRLTGAAATAWRPGHTPPGGDPPWPDPTDFLHRTASWNPWLAQARDSVGEGRATRLLSEGAGAPLDRTVAEALASIDAPARVPLPRSPRERALPRAPLSVQRLLPAPLTRRESQVAALIASGASNRHIAASLTITERTAMRHVEHILAKLGLRSRTQIAVWFLERERDDACDAAPPPGGPKQ